MIASLTHLSPGALEEHLQDLSKSESYVAPVLDGADLICRVAVCCFECSSSTTNAFAALARRSGNFFQKSIPCLVHFGMSTAVLLVMC